MSTKKQQAKEQPASVQAFLDARKEWMTPIDFVLIVMESIWVACEHIKKHAHCSGKEASEQLGFFFTGGLHTVVQTDPDVQTVTDLDRIKVHEMMEEKYQLVNGGRGKRGA